LAEFTIDDLAELLCECGGEDEIPDLAGQVADVPFEDLGYDSLVLFNIVCRIERSRSIRLTDEAVAGALTPRGLLNVINSRLEARAGQGAG